MNPSPIRLFLAGDAIVSVPWSDCDDHAFINLVAEMRACDATIVNLETVIRSDSGFPQAESGGVWANSKPAIASELAWAGVNMVAHANNHAFDYGSGGVLETIKHVEKADIVLSGSGVDLTEARAPRYFKAKNETIGHVSLAATFVPYARASFARPDSRGRPGINPLRIHNEQIHVVPAFLINLFSRIDAFRGKKTPRYGHELFIRFGRLFKSGEKFEILRPGRIHKEDRDGNLEAIAASAQNADITLVSIHTHDHRNWLRSFVRDAIGAGADIVLIHGPHHVLGIEIIDGKPVFYGLGDFAFQTAQMEGFPADAYEKLNLPHDASRSDLIRESRKHSGLWKPSTYEGCAAIVDWNADGLSGINLLPLDLGFNQPESSLGRPRLADQKLGKQIINEIAKASTQFGTRIRFNDVKNVGAVEL